jgi:hypothetical protein
MTEFPIPEAFAEFDFPVVSVWGLTDKHECRCVRGKDCPTPGKHPIPHDGFKSATTDIERLRLMLSAPGSQGQWGLRPAPNTILIDADGEGFAERVKELGLTETLIVRSGAGLHLYFHWPPEYGPVPTHLFGWKVRSNDHQGIVVGPGSQHVSGRTYRFHHQNGHSAYEMLATIATFPKALVPVSPTKPKTAQVESITVGQGARQPEDIEVGGRHDYLRDSARFLRGRFEGEALFEQVMALNLRLREPKDEESVRRAIGDVETKFGPDPTPVDPTTIPVASLFIKQPDYHAANSAVPLYVSPLVAYGTVALVSGPPKGGKSTLISNLLAAREANSVFLWGDPVPRGPMALVTEEGGFPVVRKTAGLPSLDILDRMGFVVAGLRTLDHLLVVLGEWVKVQPSSEPPLVIIDTLAVWGDIKDENDAVAATRAIVALRVWAQSCDAAVILVHHTRKGGGDHGEAIRGSGGIFAAVDQSVELAFTNDVLSDDRTLAVVGRLAFSETKALAFDRPSMTYSVTTRAVVEKYPTDQFPLDGGKEAGFTKDEAAAVWGMGPGAAGNRLRELVEKGTLVVRSVRADGARTLHNEYWKARPLLDLDNRSVGEQMADIFKSE